MAKKTPPRAARCYGGLRDHVHQLGGFALNTQFGFIALLHCRTRILSYPEKETKGHDKKTSFHLWDNSSSPLCDRISP